MPNLSASLRIIALLLVALVPQLAYAHRGEHHVVAPAQTQAEQQFETRSWSNSCPGGLGGKCCCSAATVGGAHPTPTLASPAWRLVSAVRSYAAVPAYTVTRPLQPFFSSAPARAPPLPA